MLTELFEIQCHDDCRCYAEDLDALERVLEWWRPHFVSIRRVSLDPFELAEKEELICGKKRWEPACQRRNNYRMPARE